MTDDAPRPEEHFYRISTVTLTIQEAFAFIMGHLDVIDDQQITISPVWFSDADDVLVRRFECSVAGTPKVPVTAPG